MRVIDDQRRLTPLELETDRREAFFGFIRMADQRLMAAVLNDFNAGANTQLIKRLDRLARCR